MSRLVILFAILSIVLSATAKDVTVQITGVEALTLTIPEDWEALVSQVKVMDDYPEGPSELISVGPPVNRGPFSVGDDIPEEQPQLSIYPRSQLYELPQLRASFRFTKLPLKFDDGDKMLIIEEVRDSSDSVAGYYHIHQEDGKTRFTADINTRVRTWGASAQYPAAKNQFSEPFIAVIHSIVNTQEMNPSSPVQILTIHDSHGSDSHEPPPTNTEQLREKKLSKIICPRCKGEQEAMKECSFCRMQGYIWVEKPTE
jgi:hypothetical protein